MATIVNETIATERRIAERRHYPAQAQVGSWVDKAFRVSWAGIWAGVLATLGTLLLLSALGLAIGVSATDFQDPDRRALEAGAAIWGGLALLVSLFVGGMLSTRLAMITDRSTGMYEGALVWALSMILIMSLATSGIGMLSSGAFSLMGRAGGAAGALGGMPNLEVTRGDVDGLVARLRDPSTAQQVANATGLPVDDVRTTLDRTATSVQGVRDNPAAVAAEVRRGVGDLLSRAPVMERVESAGRTSAWAGFLTLLLSLAAAVGGAALGRRRAARHQFPAASATPTSATSSTTSPT
jgi:hypothetical protein